MEQWIIDFTLITILLICIISIIANTIIIIKNKVRKTAYFFLILSIIVSITDILYASSHSTYYKYNDWIILNSNISMVREKYGEFDYGNIDKNKSGTVGYYIYTDNSPIMPDHLRHYYYMKYDNWGMIYEVYEACEVGG